MATEPTEVTEVKLHEVIQVAWQMWESDRTAALQLYRHFNEKLTGYMPTLSQATAVFWHTSNAIHTKKLKETLQENKEQEKETT